MSSRRAFLAAIAATPGALAVSDAECVEHTTTALIIKIKGGCSPHQSKIIAEQCIEFNKIRRQCGFTELPIMLVDESKISIEQVQK